MILHRNTTDSIVRDILDLPEKKQSHPVTAPLTINTLDWDVVRLPDSYGKFSTELAQLLNTWLDAHR